MGSGIECSGDNENVDLNRVRENVLAGNQQKRKLRVGTWNFSGLSSEHKQKEVGELLKVNNIDVVASQESWEKEDSRKSVDRYKWFGKPHDVQRWEGGVAFLVHDCLVNEVELVGEVKYAVELVGEVKYAEGVLMKVRGERGSSALYIGCVYMPTDGSGKATIDDSYNLLKEDVLTFKQKGKVGLLGDFNARVGRSSEVDHVIGMFGEETFNASGKKLISFLNEVELVVCNGRKLLSIRVHLSPGSSCGLLAYASARRYYNFPHICG